MLSRYHDLETQFYSLALINVIMSKGGESLRSVISDYLAHPEDICSSSVPCGSDVLFVRFHPSSRTGAISDHWRKTALFTP